MRVVVDTNVLISGTFFGGHPSQIVEAAAQGYISVVATPEIITEYVDIAQEMVSRKQGTLRLDAFQTFLSKLELVNQVTPVSVCRDPDDDKFLSCAIDGRALWIVSGDKDLLTIGTYQNIEIVTASEFYERFLK
ncbi:MAG: putative toxin-antitoxin system toxin component, PIN family [Actinomycetaceae bacterium]|nr:putative toxin-antitoxin system toxin component, PIN family [Actinomycetaceae bacterium]